MREGSHSEHSSKVQSRHLSGVTEERQWKSLCQASGFETKTFRMRIQSSTADELRTLSVLL